MTVWPMSGAGNTFAVLDNRTEHHSLDVLQSITPALCDRSVLGLRPAEGVLVLQQADAHSFRGDFLNPDGSYGAMCGNGGRCIVRFATARSCVANDAGIIPFELSGTAYWARTVDADHITVHFPAPLQMEQYSVGALDDISVPVLYVNVHSDHAVIRAADLNIPIADFRTFDLAAVALPIRHHRMFARGVNVNVYAIDSTRMVLLRTFERGVEAETGACGTGALSTALAARQWDGIGSRARIMPPSGRELTVDILDNTELLLTGDAMFDAPPSEFDISTQQYL